MLVIILVFYIYGSIRLKEISILNSFEQVQENTIAIHVIFYDLAQNSRFFASLYDLPLKKQNLPPRKKSFVGFSSTYHFKVYR